jgi:hypothetical protein
MSKHTWTTLGSAPEPSHTDAAVCDCRRSHDKAGLKSEAVVWDSL